MIDHGLPPKLVVLDIMRSFAKDVLKVSWDDVLDTDRSPYKARHRFAIWYLLHIYEEMSCPTIAVNFARDHTSVLHGVRRFRKTGNVQRMVKLWKNYKRNV